jgi:hypothetical protein
MTIDGVLVHDSRDNDLQVLSPKLDLALNASARLSFGLAPSHPYYAVPTERKSLVRVVEVGDPEPLFYGQVLNIDTPLDAVSHITCEGDLGFLTETPMRPFDYTGDPTGMLSLILSAHNGAQPDAARRLALGNVTVIDPNDYVVRSSEDTTSCFEALRDKLFDSSLGGYVRTRGTGATRYLDYTTDTGPLNTQIIELGVNILDITRQIRGDQVITALIPYGAEVEDPDTGVSSRVTIAGVNGGADYLTSPAADIFGVIYGVMVWDDVTQPQHLLTKAQAYLAQRSLLPVSFELRALDLHLLDVDVTRIFLGDQLRVRSIPHGVDTVMSVSAMGIDLTDVRNTSITLGATRPSAMAKTSADIRKAADKVMTSVAANYATNEAVHDVSSSVLDLASEIIQTATQIRLEVASTYVDKSTNSSELEELRSSIAQNAGSIALSVSQLLSMISGVDDTLTERFDSMETSVFIDLAGVHIRKSINGDLGKYEVFIDESSFRIRAITSGDPPSDPSTDTAAVAWIDDDEMHIYNATIVNALNLGGFKFEPRASGNMSLVWVG